MGQYEAGMNSARLEFLMKDKDIRRKPKKAECHERVERRVPRPPKCHDAGTAEGPRKVKFVLFLNNAAIINANTAVAADNNCIR
jgi:hypothetical protein